MADLDRASTLVDGIASNYSVANLHIERQGDAIALFIGTGAGAMEFSFRLDRSSAERVANVLASIASDISGTPDPRTVVRNISTLRRY